jgi:hypothetical protein
VNRADSASAGITFTNHRDAPEVPDEPVMEIHSWRLMKAPSGELHLGMLGNCQAKCAVVRLTSAIIAFDIATSAVITASGRRYLLKGPPESRLLECAAIRNGAAQLGLAGGIDISAQFWALMHEASGRGDGNDRS